MHYNMMYFRFVYSDIGNTGYADIMLMHWID